MDYLPLVAFVVIIVVFIVYAGRQRRRQQAAQLEQASAIVAGTEIMTTSGLYGTVIARNDDDTVVLSIAPGIEVKWELAALRDIATLPDRFRGAPAPAPEPPIVLDKDESERPD